MIYAVSMTAGVTHDRLEGRIEAILSRMSEMLQLSEQQVVSLLSDASAAGQSEYVHSDVRAWVRAIGLQ